MIDAVINEPFTAILSDYEPAIASELTLEVYDPATGTAILAASGTGITEPRGGTYRANRTITTAGSFLLRWARPTAIDPDDLVVAEESLAVRDVAVTTIPDSVRPELTEVGAVIRARTAYMGQELGTFTANTRPTGDEVADYIDQAFAEVDLRLPGEIPTHLLAFTRRLVAIRAAMMIEVSYSPDRAEADSTAYDRLREMFDAGMAAVHDALADAAQGGPDTGRLVSLPLTTPTATYSAELGLDAPGLLP